MTDLRRYRSPEAFKHALEMRIRHAAREANEDMGRFRQLLVFDRFLARVFEELGEQVVLKGGIALELRLERARTTRDIDLRLTGDPGRLLAHLQHAGQRDLGDHLSFLIQPNPERPTVAGDGVIYDGRRFRAEGRLAGMIYGLPFGVDVSVGDVLTRPPEIITGTRFLDFVGVKPAQMRVYPREAHVAEKLHAYTLPRPMENSRVKDLPDIALLAQTGPFEHAKLRQAFEGTFSFRKTHLLPTRLPSPPPSWTSVYARIAAEDRLPWRTLDEVKSAARAFVDPALVEGAGTWDPASWGWIPGSGSRTSGAK